MEKRLFQWQQSRDEGLEKAMMGWKSKGPPELFFLHVYAQMCVCSILSILVWMRHPALVGCGKEIVSMAVTTGYPSSEGLEKAMMGWKCKCPPEMVFSHSWCQPRVTHGRLVWRAPMAKITGCPNSEGLEKAIMGWKFKGPPELVFLHL